MTRTMKAHSMAKGRRSADLVHFCPLPTAVVSAQGLHASSIWVPRRTVSSFGLGLYGTEVTIVKTRSAGLRDQSLANITKPKRTTPNGTSVSRAVSIRVIGYLVQP